MVQRRSSYCRCRIWCRLCNNSHWVKLQSSHRRNRGGLQCGHGLQHRVDSSRQHPHRYDVSTRTSGRPLRSGKHGQFRHRLEHGPYDWVELPSSFRTTGHNWGGFDLDLGARQATRVACLLVARVVEFWSVGRKYSSGLRQMAGMSRDRSTSVRSALRNTRLLRR